MGPYQYLMYMRCLALQLSAINSVSTGDVVDIINTFILLLTVITLVIIIIITVPIFTNSIKSWDRDLVQPSPHLLSSSPSSSS